jgi:hypothetical protein
LPSVQFEVGARQVPGVSRTSGSSGAAAALAVLRLSTLDLIEIGIGETTGI